MISRIMTTSVHVLVDNAQYNIRENVDWDTHYLVDRYSEELRRSLRFDRMLDREGAIRLLVRRGILEEDFSKNLVKLNNQKESNLIQIYLSRDNPATLTSYREKNRKLDGMVARYSSAIDELMPATKDYLISYFSSLYLTSLIATPKVEEDNYELLAKIQRKYLSTLPSLDSVRTLARTYEWRTQWAAKKSDAFPSSPLSSIQCALANLSQMYDNASQHPDAPDNLLDFDDDVFDGWLLWTKRKDKDQTPKNKAMQHSEVFVIAKDQDEANLINSSNNPEALRIQKQRMSELARKGKMSIGQFSDVQERRLNESAKARSGQT